MRAEVVGKCRLEATLSVIGQRLSPASVVIEIGSNDASFRAGFQTRSWTTVDKFGSPDVLIDINGPSVRLPFDDGSCDLVICTEVLEHLTMGAPFVREMARVLKADGAALVSVPNIVSLKSRFKVLLGALPNMAASGDCGVPLGGTGVLSDDGNWIAGHVVDFNKQRLRAYLGRGGFVNFRWHSVPVQFPRRFRALVLPSWLMPPSFGDFLMVEAGKS